MNINPTKLEVIGGDALRIAWSDNQMRDYTFRELRDACPCATCRERRKILPAASLFPIVTDAEIRPLRITAMKPVGNYAYSIEFSDGHNTGIYTLESLRELGTVVSP